MSKKSLLMLENGYYQYGKLFSGNGNVFGEFVFNTSMTGYEEILTDPSYKGQVVVFTYPLIGNYGITEEDFQSKDIKSEAIVVRENSRIFSNHRAKKSLADFLNKQNIIGIEGIDTRALTKQIRIKGAMMGGITSEEISPEEFLVKVKSAGTISDADVYKEVIGTEVVTFNGTNENNLKIIALDFGIKSNIIEDLKRYYNKIYLVPFNDNFEKNISNLEFDGVFVSNGPGDPRVVEGVQQFIKKFADSKIPIIAICFGHQLIGKTFGLNVIKLPFGHHGGNHPVKYIENGKVYITAQNHNYSIAADEFSKNSDWELTWVNLYDNTVEGMKHKYLNINCVQFHPEASPGPNEANERVFGDFYKTVAGGNK